MAGKMSARQWPARRIVGPALGSPLLQLGGLAVLNAAVYLLVFVRPWGLVSLASQPLLDLRDLSAGDPLVRWRLLASFGLLGLSYWRGWCAARQTQGRTGWLLVLASAATSGAILLFLYPFGAADLFDNVMHGRILAVYGENPFARPAMDFLADPFYPYVGWRRFPTAYGPGWELMAAATVRLAGDGLLASALAFKALGGLFLAGCIAIVALLLRRTAPERALAGTLLLAWNPIVLYETLGQGHNDAAMVFWILACAGFLAWRRYTLALLALVAGALVKFVPLLLLPAAALIALRSLTGSRARLRFVALTACAAVLLVLLAYAPFWRGSETLAIEHRRALFTTSLPAVAGVLLEEPLGRERAGSVVSLAAAGITACFALWQGVRASRNPSWRSFVQAAFLILIFYLLFTCLWFQQWYAIWPLGLVPLLPAHLAWLGVSIGFAVLAKPLIAEPLWMWPRPTPSRVWQQLRLGPAVLALPWLLAAVALLWGRGTRSLEGGSERGPD